MTCPKHLTDKDFSDLLEAHGIGPKDGPFAVAVSGGPDSMALALLFSKFSRAHYLTFDHGLRPESSGEAKQVGEWLKKKGLSHTILAWLGDKPEAGLPAAARAARYQAMEAWCKTNRVRFLLTAHHLEDQAETFLMRLLKGSGVDGLAAMAPKSGGLFEPEITILRPFLMVSKDRLKATLKENNQEWFEDPSNENTDFTRVKIRNALKKSKNLDFETLAGTAARLANVKEVLNGLVKNFLTETFFIQAPGYGVLKKAEFLKGSPEIALRALSKILTFISQSDFPPGREKLERLFHALGKEGFKGATLHGCQVSPVPGGDFLICREARDATKVLALKSGETALWDKRFKVSFKGAEVRLEVKALGEAGWENLARENPAVKEFDLPHPVRASLPAFFRDGEVVLVPHLNFSNEKFEAKADFSPKNKIFPKKQ